LPYRSTAKPVFPKAGDERDELDRQWHAVGEFWARHAALGHLAAHKLFDDIDALGVTVQADLEKAIERLIDQEATPQRARDLRTRRNPFCGLLAYDVEHAVTQLQLAQDVGCAFLMITGSSGAGKIRAASTSTMSSSRRSPKGETQELCRWSP